MIEKMHYPSLGETNHPELEGINQVSLDVDGQVTSAMEGITELRRKILQLFGQKVCQIYQISPA